MKVIIRCTALLFIMLLFVGCTGQPKGPKSSSASEAVAQSEPVIVTDIELQSESTTTTEESVSTQTSELVSDTCVDLDLTVLSSILVYSEVSNIMSSPDEYRGKIIKMNGLFDCYVDEVSGKKYFSCIIQDATACCSQGIEFVLEGDHSYPEEYPEIGQEITVTGEFDTYMEDNYMYAQLIHSDIVY